VAYGHVFSNNQGPAAIVVGAGVGNMQHATVLHAGSGADFDGVHIGANGHLGPDRNIVVQGGIPQHNS
jgi:hypothetical protein